MQLGTSILKKQALAIVLLYILQAFLNEIGFIMQKKYAIFLENQLFDTTIFLSFFHFLFNIFSLFGNGCNALTNINFRLPRDSLRPTPSK